MTVRLIREDDNSEALIWQSKVDYGPKIGTTLPPDLIPENRVWLEISSAGAQVDRRLLEFLAAD